MTGSLALIGDVRALRRRRRNGYALDSDIGVGVRGWQRFPALEHHFDFELDDLARIPERFLNVVTLRVRVRKGWNVHVEAPVQRIGFQYDGVPQRVGHAMGFLSSDSTSRLTGGSPMAVPKLSWTIA
jgi:hypothetical protein